MSIQALQQTAGSAGFSCVQGSVAQPLLSLIVRQLWEFRSATYRHATSE